ncbi:MAG: NAD(P)/FAD-dependent oxidoreductase [Cyanobacteria bacterium P01_D01_bin.50]
MHTYDVIVVGAGPVGLAIANGLRKRRIENILVLDQTRSFRRVGQAVDILPNGLKALKYLDVKAYTEVKDSLGVINHAKKSPQPSPQWYIRDLQGKIIRSIALDYNEWLEKYGEGRVSIAWFDLQTALRNLLPQEQVKANHRCVNVVHESENQWVRVDCLSDTTLEANPYAHWNSQKSTAQTQPSNISSSIEESARISFRAKLVIAADGINSTVRKAIYKNTIYDNFSIPKYSGYAAIFVPEITDIPEKIASEIKAKFLQCLPIVTITQGTKTRDSGFEISPRIILVNKTLGKFAFAINLPFDKNQLQEKYLIKNLTLQKLEKDNFPSPIQDLVRLSNPDNIQFRTFHIHAAADVNSLSFPTTAKLNNDDNSSLQSPWYQGRVVLVGDAAHGMPPFAGQGVNQGLESSLAITELINQLIASDKLNDTEAIQKTFTKYETLRRPLMAYIQKATMSGLSFSTRVEELEEYYQKVFARDFDKVVEAINN